MFIEEKKHKIPDCDTEFHYNEYVNYGNSRIVRSNRWSGTERSFTFNEFPIECNILGKDRKGLNLILECSQTTI